MRVTTMESPMDNPELCGGSMTDDQLINELNYCRAEKVTRIMLDAGLITADQYAAIMAENRRSFKPFLAELFPA